MHQQPPNPTLPGPPSPHEITYNSPSLLSNYPVPSPPKFKSNDHSESQALPLFFSGEISFLGKTPPLSFNTDLDGEVAVLGLPYNYKSCVSLLLETTIKDPRGDRCVLVRLCGLGGMLEDLVGRRFEEAFACLLERVVDLLFREFLPAP